MSLKFLLLTAALSLTACGGGDASTASFLVRGTQISTLTPHTYAVCVETGSYISLESPEGEAMKGALIKYFVLTTPLQTKANSYTACKDLDPNIDKTLSLADYNAIIVPATK